MTRERVVVVCWKTTAIAESFERRRLWYLHLTSSWDCWMWPASSQSVAPWIIPCLLSLQLCVCVSCCRFCCSLGETQYQREDFRDGFEDRLRAYAEECDHLVVSSLSTGSTTLSEASPEINRMVLPRCKSCGLKYLVFELLGGFRNRNGVFVVRSDQ